MNRFMRSVLRASIYFIFVMLTLVMFTLGPKLEVLINPVVSGFNINRAWKNEGLYLIEGVLLKNRGECEITGISMQANGGVTDEFSKIVRLDFTHDPSHQDYQLVSRPSGAQYWGPWIITPPIEPIGPIFTIVVTHRCHALWELSTVIYTGLTEDIFPDLIIDRE